MTGRRRFGFAWARFNADDVILRADGSCRTEVLQRDIEIVIEIKDALQ